jgi:uncharacterized membrane protein YjgN (DUF898 family)
MLDQTPALPVGEAYDAPLPEIVRHRPEFSGRAGEYFGIWIVNVLLTILTLGIYSAWAKVRTERYFYGNTRLAGSAFEYLADPIRILKGRLIAYAVVIALGLSSHFMPVLYLILIGAVYLCVPLLICLATRFRARYSAWRGLRFGFVNGVGEAYGPFLGWVLLSGLSLSLLSPLAKRRQHEYLVSGHRFGSAAFTFHGNAGDYYVPYLVAIGLGVLVFAGGFGLMLGAGAIASVAGGSDAAGAPGGASMAAIFAGMALFYLGLFAVLAYLRTQQTNLLWNNTRLGEHRFESTLESHVVIWLYFSNLVAILCTLGLATPWAMVRLARYRAEHFALVANGSLDEFVTELGADRNATGAEMVDALDLGMDIGL